MSTKSIGSIASLDGLRAVSILIVFLAHSGLKGIVPGFSACAGASPSLGGAAPRGERVRDADE